MQTMDDEDILLVPKEESFLESKELRNWEAEDPNNFEITKVISVDPYTIGAEGY